MKEKNQKIIFDSSIAISFGFTRFKCPI